ncbi:hypothetical protein X805_34850 [Sphaerotilus natans subsp. natans DSM 6575]|uniref:Uncharacterized protein n=1 Tax=Sphaerotilus natans subsp. natans DSM 6575 TaxID=1286631 RepID=A0A059KIE5_9BURK|nr:hypothetical protein X805_34850 [Sphaerotilus natans subsp. natans DSM 6575]
MQGRWTGCQEGSWCQLDQLRFQNDVPKKLQFACMGGIIKDMEKNETAVH